MPSWTRPWLAIAAVGFTLPLSGCIKAVFRDLSYPEKPPAIVARDTELSVAATLLPELLADYDQPPLAGACLQELGDDATLESLLDYGACLPRQTQQAPGGAEDPLGAPMRACLGTLRFLASPAKDWKLSPRCEASPADQLRLAARLTSVGEVGHAYLLSASGSRDVSRFRPAVVQGLRASIKAAAQLLRSDPTPPGKNNPGANEPMLALSGGAANGAFTAGYLHALLSMRELALATLRKQGSTGESAASTVDAETRFGGAASTSVGTLVALPLDLYFSDVDAAGISALAPHLRECLGRQELGGRPVQDCALAFLRREFTERSESDLLCVEKGTVLALLSDRTNALRFDPLRDDILQPFLRNYGQVILNNPFQRTAIAADLKQNVAVGLDERACRMQGIPRDECLVSAVLASIDEPIFTQGEPRVFSGLRPEGEKGLWLDGGLRSGTPAVRALDMTHKRVLAINTHRAEGVPGEKFENAGDVFFGMIDTFVAQTRQWELSYAQLHRVRRNMDACTVWQHTRMEANPFGCEAKTEGVNVGRMAGVPTLLLRGDVFPVFVPEDIDPAELYAAGYTFDPHTTSGLFAWGQKTFLESREPVLRWLGWPQLIDLRVPGAELDNREYLQGIERMAAESQAVIDALVKERQSPDYTKRYEQHRKERRSNIDEHMKTCR